jgi:peptide/nickel transport system ATP-binding protein
VSAAALPPTVEVAPPSSSAPESPLASSSEPRTSSDVVLDVRGLKTYFYTYDGVVHALEGVKFKIRRGETLGLVGETGCGKSVTSFSITRLIPDPPGRIMEGRILLHGANLLWGIEQEATFKEVRKSGRYTIKRKYRRLRDVQRRMIAVRGSLISMIFQEPMLALNPVFRVSNQVGEALTLHRLQPIVAEMVQAAGMAAPATADAGAPPTKGSARRDSAATQAAVDRLVDAAVHRNSAEMRTASLEIAQSTGLTTLGTEAYYTAREESVFEPDQLKARINHCFDRIHLSGLQTSYLKYRTQSAQLYDELREVYLQEMRQERPERAQRRSIARRQRVLQLRALPFRLPGVKRYVNRPLDTELFWRSVRLLEQVSIANPAQVARSYPHELSGGMVQRVMIAMALSSEPEILIADEPTTALDVTIQAQILELMRNLKTRVGTAILLITHDLGVIAEVADRVCVMYAGNIIETAPVTELFRRPLHPYTQGLLASIPRVDDPSKKLESIPGSVPNLISPPTGCRFHPRCPFAMPVCKEKVPPTTVEGPQHTVACFLYNGPEDVS